MAKGVVEVEQSAVATGHPALRELEPWERLYVEAEKLEQRATGLRQLAALIPRDGLSGSARRYLGVTVAALLK